MKFDNRSRSSRYLFTVTTKEFSTGANEFFAKLCQEFRRCGGTGGLLRYGRQRNRKGLGVAGRYGHVRLVYSDRFDVYIKEYSEQNIKAIRSLLTSRPVWTFKSLIEYANIDYKPELDVIFGSQPAITPIPVKTHTINNINTTQTLQPMKTTTKWKVNLRTEIISDGDTLDDLRKTIEKLGFDQSDLISYEKLDTHRDLPLVSFGYPEHGNEMSDTKLRRIRVTKMDTEVVEGWENETWKKFLRSKIVGNVVVSEIPAKQ